MRCSAEDAEVARGQESIGMSDASEGDKGPPSDLEREDTKSFRATVKGVCAVKVKFRYGAL